MKKLIVACMLLLLFISTTSFAEFEKFIPNLDFEGCEKVGSDNYTASTKALIDGMKYFESKEWQKARIRFNEAIELDICNSVAYYGRATILICLGTQIYIEENDRAGANAYFALAKEDFEWACLFGSAFACETYEKLKSKGVFEDAWELKEDKKYMFMEINIKRRNKNEQP